jgi:putative transposase
MPRANRYHLPGHVWHLTHRCHQREFLLKFSRDRDRYRYWLFEAKKRFGLCVLDFAITSNHVHLLVKDTAPNVIAQSLQLVAGRTAQEYNQRKGRKGAYWEDRYHATAVQADGHLARCMAYIDLNMVRAGVVSHPAEWAHGGYAQIQAPPARYGVIDLGALCELFGFADVAALQAAQREWVDESLRSDGRAQAPEWANAIAVGSPDFVAKVKSDLGISACHRHVDVSGTTGVLREPEAPYRHEMPGENGRLSVRNSYLWNGA